VAGFAAGYEGRVLRAVTGREDGLPAALPVLLHEQRRLGRVTGVVDDVRLLRQDGIDDRRVVGRRLDALAKDDAAAVAADARDHRIGEAGTVRRLVVDQRDGFALHHLDHEVAGAVALARVVGEVAGEPLPTLLREVRARGGRGELRSLRRRETRARRR